MQSLRKYPLLRRRAFTLIELLTVIAIIGILAILIAPMATKVRDSALATKCLGNMRNYGNAVLLFAGDNQGLPWWNGQPYPASAEPPSTRPTFETWVRPYLEYKNLAQRLRCPLKPGNATDYSFEYGGNQALCWYYPKLLGLPVPSTRVVLAGEGISYDGWYVGSSLNTPMWGTADASPGPPGAALQYHGEKIKRGLNLFFLDGHVALISPETGDWRKGKSPTYGDSTNGGIFYDYQQFSDMKAGKLGAH